MIEANLALETANRAKNEFLAALSHELSRAALYYRPVEVGTGELELMALIRL